MKYSTIFRPIQLAGPKLRSLLSDLGKKKKLLIRIVGFVLAGAYFIFAGLLPDYYIHKHYADGHAYVNLYSHLFRYGEFFGWMTVLLLIPPVTYLASESSNIQIPWLLVFVGVIVCSALGLLVDFQSENIAPHEIRAEIIENDPQLKYHFTKGSRTEDDKTDYQRKTVSLIQERANWSVARYLHYLTIFIMTSQLVFIAVVVVALLKCGLTQRLKESPEFKMALVYCSLAILISYFWVLMRMAFVQQKPDYFPSISNPVAEFTLLFFCIVATSLIVYRLLSLSGFREELSIILGVGSLFFSALSVLSVWKFQGALVKAFGRDARMIHYWTPFIAIAFLSVFAILGYTMKVKQQSEIAETDEG